MKYTEREETIARQSFILGFITAVVVCLIILSYTIPRALKAEVTKMTAGVNQSAMRTCIEGCGYNFNK